MTNGPGSIPVSQLPREPPLPPSSKRQPAPKPKYPSLSTFGGKPIDPLATERIVNYERLDEEAPGWETNTELGYRPATLEPADQFRYTRNLVVMATEAVMVITVLLYLFGTFWVTPPGVGVITGICFLGAVLVFGPRPMAWLAFAALGPVAAFGLWLLSRILVDIHIAGLGMVALVVVSLALAVCPTLMVFHYTTWLQADHRLTSFNVPLGRTLLFAFFTTAATSLVLALLANLRTDRDPALGIHITILVMLAGTVFAVVSFYRSERFNQHVRGLLSYMTYGVYQRRAPGIWQSPAGRPFIRHTFVILTLTAIAWMVLPLFRFFPVAFEWNRPEWLSQDPTAWMFDAFYAVAENPAAPLSLIVSAFASLYFPLFVFVALSLVSLSFVTRWVVPYVTDPEHRYGDDVSPWEATVRRLALSDNDLERRHLWTGIHSEQNFPVMLQRDILGEHAYVVGDTGSGKTALGVTPIITQLIRGFDTESAGKRHHLQSPVVIIDLKGDMAMFQAARAEAEQASSEFKWFTNEVGKSTFTFNPFLQGTEETLSINQVAENLLEALNLHHGDGYGRSYFSRVNRRWLTSTLRERPDAKSFAELYELTTKADNFAEPKQRQDAFELISVIESLAAFQQLNITPANRHATKHAIHMPEVIEKNQVVYFWLPAAVESASVREIAKLVIYAYLTAARQFNQGNEDPKQCYLVIDEFQRIASENFKIVLEQARAMGIGAILSNQTIADLKTADVDLRPTVETNTRLKMCFSATDLDQQERIMKGSGQTNRTTYLFEVEGLELAPTSLHERLYERNKPTNRVTWTRAGTNLMKTDVYRDDRLNRNWLIRISDHPRQCIFHVARGSGYTQCSGFPIPVEVDYAITKSEYGKRLYAGWPSMQAGTIEVSAERAVLDPPRYTTAKARINAEKDFGGASATAGDWNTILDAEYEQRRRDKPAS